MLIKYISRINPTRYEVEVSDVSSNWHMYSMEGKGVVMFEKVYLDLFVTCWWATILVMVDVGIVLTKLVHFKLNTIMSLGDTPG